VNSASIRVDIDLYDVVREFSSEDILAALKAHHQQEFMLEHSISVADVLPRVIHSLNATQRAAEGRKEWNTANRLCDLRNAIQAALDKYLAR